MSKQYGLIVPNKHKHEHKVGTLVAKNSAFDDDSGSDEDAKKPINFNVTKLKRQDKVMQEKAIEEDPTVYQYDEVYDEIDKKRKESKLARKDIDKKPKYINKLLVAADRRKRENERRIEKQVQKEREAEGDEFKDKESFVTTAYRKKLEEMKALEAEEQREEYLESIGDVKRQGNLDGFYRHLYDQKVNYADKITKENEANSEPQKSSNAESVNESNEEPESPNKQESKSKTKNLKRKYRKHNSISENESEDEEETKKKLEHLPSNIDADSDFSIDSSDSEDEEKNKSKKSKVENTDADNVNNDNKENEIKKENDADKDSIVKTEEPDKDKNEEEPKPEIKKPKIDIWKKRTVGEIFDAALQRYFERKALRESGN